MHARKLLFLVLFVSGCSSDSTQNAQDIADTTAAAATCQLNITSTVTQSISADAGYVTTVNFDNLMLLPGCAELDVMWRAKMMTFAQNLIAGMDARIRQ